MKTLTIIKRKNDKTPVKTDAGKAQEKTTIPAPKGNGHDPSMGDFLERIQLFAVGLDLYGTIFFCNDHFLKVTGSRKEQVIGHDWFTLFAPPSRKEELRRLYLSNILLGTYPPQPTFEIQNSREEQHLISWTCSTLRNGGEKITGLFCIGTEIDFQNVTPEEAKTPEPVCLKDSLDFEPQMKPLEASPAESSGNGQGVTLNGPTEKAETEKPGDRRQDSPVDRGGKYLTFLLGKEEFGIGIGSIKEIMGVVPIRSIPRTPSYLKGVINLRGSIVPVVDLRLKFGMETLAYTPKTCIVVLEVAGAEAPFRTGIIVDSVLEVVNIKENEIDDTPSFGVELDAQYILGMAKSNGKVKILLKMEKVLDEQTLLAARQTDPAFRSL